MDRCLTITIIKIPVVILVISPTMLDRQAIFDYVISVRNWFQSKTG